MEDKTNNFPYDLKIVLIWVVLTGALVLIPFFEGTFLRIIFAWTMVLFLPGYALIAFLFPEKKDLDFIERIALSFGLSAAITPVLGLILNFTPFGIRLLPIVVILSLFILLFTVLAYVKLKKIPNAERFNENLNFSTAYSNISGSLKIPEKGMDKTLFIIMILSAAFCVFTLIFVITVPKEGEKFTEFYILNTNGTANWYPTNLSTGDAGIVNVNVVSHEHERVTYELLIKWNDSETLHSEQISLGDNETFSRDFTFTAGEQGTKKLEFLLYKNNETYRNLHLWVNII